MAKKTEFPLLDLGIIAAVNVPSGDSFSSSKPFRCPPGFIYCVFRQTSVGSEFVESFGLNESGKLRENEEIYRISISDIPARFVDREAYIFSDGTTIELETELFVKITNGAKVVRLTVQDQFDPLKRLQDDIRWLLEHTFKQYNYSQVFSPKTKQVNLDIRGYGEKIKQQALMKNYGLEITKVRLRLILPPKLKKRWEADLAQQEITETEGYKQDEQLRAELKQEIALLDLDAARLEAQIDQQLEKFKQEKEPETRRREYSTSLEEETVQQKEIHSETELGFAKQHNQFRLEAEKKAEERRQQIESLRHQVNAASLIAQIEQLRQKEEELEKIHQLRLQRLEELAMALIEERDKLSLVDTKYHIGRGRSRAPESTDFRLDAGVPDKVILDQVFDLAIAVRQITALVHFDKDFSEVKSGGLQVSWSESQPYVRLQVQVSSPDCEIFGKDSCSFRLYSGRDSPVFYFQLTPKKLGKIGIVVQIYQEDDWLGSTRVYTSVHEQMVGNVQIETISHQLKSIPTLSTEQVEFIERQISILYRRLQKLREVQATKGIDTEPHYLIEIEDIEKKIDGLEKQRKIIGES